MKKGLKLLILSDLLILMGFGLISLILSIFVKDSLINGSAFAAGLAVTIFLITKSILEIPFGKIEDKTSKKFFLIFGSYLIAIAPLGYFFMTKTIHLYIIQVIYGIGAAMAFPSFTVLFYRYMDKGHEAFDSGVYGTIVGIGAGITAFVGGALVEKFSFKTLFLATFIICVIGASILFLVDEKHLKKR